MKLLTQILNFFPYVLQCVTAVEQTAVGVDGATKKTIVLNAIVAVAKIGEKIPEAHIAIISSLIDAIVTQLNNSGVFTHSKPAA